jgi:glyoxalase family protein
MRHPIHSLHHVTATVAGAQEDLDFCAGLLGLRLVKQTVNFDNHRVYHFYYGDEVGRPGTIWTTFPYRGQGVAVGEKGAGQITTTAFSAPAGSLGYWADRLRERFVAVALAQSPFGEEVVRFQDPSGLWFELVANAQDYRKPWTGPGVDPAASIRGLHSVTLTIRDPGPTVQLLTGLLGFRTVGEVEGRIRLAVGDAAPGHMLEIRVEPDAAPARNGLGTVHHVALAIDSGEEQLRLRAELLRQDYRVTEVMDRNYFQSIYFREPGGVLLEVATVQPGFTVDEPEAFLGQSLRLPAWEEPNRQAIEAALEPVSHRPAAP